MTEVVFRKDFQQDRDTHVWNFRLLEDWMDQPLNTQSGSISRILTIGDVNSRHLDLGPQTVDGIDYFIIAWEADTIVTALLADGTWT